MEKLIKQIGIFLIVVSGYAYSADILFYICKGDGVSLRFAYPKFGVRESNIFILEVGEDEITFLDTEKVRLFPSLNNGFAQMIVEARDLSHKIERKAVLSVVLPDEDKISSFQEDIDFTLPFTTTIKMITNDLDKETKLSITSKMSCEVFGLAKESGVLKSIENNIIDQI